MTLIASAGIVIASAALFIVLSGFAGLKTFSLSFSSFVDPDLKVMPAQGKTFSLDKATLNKIEALDGVANISKIVEERVVISVDNKNVLATLKGVDSNYHKVTGIKQMVAQGSWLENNSLQVVSGWGISNELSFGVLDFSRSLEIYVPKPGSGQITSVKGAFNSINVVNVGLFDINEEMNQKYIFADINTAKILLNYSEDIISALEVKFQPNAKETSIRSALTNIIKDEVVIKNRVQLNDALYKMLNTENLAVYLIFTLVIIIALFNVIGAIIMMILDKKKSLNTLFNLGANASTIKRIFFIQGSLMTLISGIIGLVLGLIIVWLQHTLELVMITPSLPYPVEIKVWNLVIVLLTITILGLIAAKIASARINKKLLQSL
ncbi:FtsX-like permease family protein [Paucihalobacter ruber]|uniref:FtsX-like permease family protein n=2 Tax=Paucihalobacter ruber TaxID=2567861 RepID=A0A506PN10_9FLAO|nr:FtsX-like permease family protein [Paucihalobacter ruber]